MTRTQDFNLTVRCKLNDEYFQNWHDLSPEIQIFWDQMEVQPDCEGTGEMSAWCAGCPFCDLFEIEEA